MVSRKTKIRLISRLISLILFASIAGAAWGEEKPQAVSQAGEEMSQVPSAILTALKKVNGSGKKSRSGGVQEASIIKVQPGQNVNLTVAGGQLNRIVTPFTNPKVNTVSKVEINVDGSVLYVSVPHDGGPSTIFVTESGEADPSISLTLVPKDIAPREIRLQFSGGVGPTISLSGGKSAKWEKNQPYIEAIEKVLMGTARGEVPPGYNLRNPINLDPMPRCRLPVQVEPRQVLEGHSFLVVVSKLTNISSAAMMVDESACYYEGVRAVAVWPDVRLNPRQSTELYVVFGRDNGQKPGKRPRVLYQGPPKHQPKRVKSRPRPEPESGSLAISEVIHTPHPMAANLP